MLVCTCLAFLFVRRSSTVPMASYSLAEIKDVYGKNWIEALGVVILDAVYFAFFPGVML